MKKKLSNNIKWKKISKNVGDIGRYRKERGGEGIKKKYERKEERGK